VKWERKGGGVCREATERDHRGRGLGAGRGAVAAAVVAEAAASAAGLGVSVCVHNAGPRRRTSEGCPAVR
jgi:hypothetical protein